MEKWKSRGKREKILAKEKRDDGFFGQHGFELAHCKLVAAE